ncbi:MAG: RNA polymerase sigma factor, partial [Candidatus Hodarchaeota archaeon]
FGFRIYRTSSTAKNYILFGSGLSGLGNIMMQFWDIYYGHCDRVKKFIVSLVKDEWVADDLFQETFLRVQKNLDQVKDPSKLSSWIFQIAYNLSRDHFRQSKKILTPIEQHETEVFSIPCFQKELEKHEMGQCVQDQIMLLPESLRAALVLFDIMDFSHQEISEVLGISVENVKVRLHRARKKLKAILEQKCRFELDERNVLVCEPVKINSSHVRK